MQTNDKMGIECDLCYAVYRDDFEYVSVDAKKQRLYNGVKPSLQELLGAKTTKSFDICTLCYDNLVSQILKNYAEKDKRKVFCEITGEYVSGYDTFYYLVCCTVNVNILLQPYVCKKCGKKYHELPTNCECRSSDFTKVADISSGNRDLEVIISSSVFQDWDAKSQERKSSSWSSKS
jgi:hypothetical protein